MPPLWAAPRPCMRFEREWMGKLAFLGALSYL